MKTEKEIREKLEEVKAKYTESKINYGRDSGIYRGGITVLEWVLDEL
jgi:hypothetical protein